MPPAHKVRSPRKNIREGEKFMAYQFTNQKVGQAKAIDNLETSFSIKGINTQNASADEFMEALTTLLDLANWTLSDAQRIVTQDVEETE